MARPDEQVGQGMAAEQARAVHDTQLSGLGRWVSGIEPAVTVFTAAADELAELVEVLRRDDTTAAEPGYMITDNGTVAIVSKNLFAGDGSRALLSDESADPGNPRPSRSERSYES